MMVAQSAAALIASLTHHGGFGRRSSFHPDSSIVQTSEPLPDRSRQIPNQLSTFPVVAVCSSDEQTAKIG
jgi:hypothetical protein